MFGNCLSEIFDFVVRKLRVKSDVIAKLRREPSGAKLGRPLCSCDASIGQILFQSASKCMRIDRIAVKKSTHQHDFWREQTQAGCDRFGVFSENTRTFFDDLHHTRIAARGGFKYDRRQERNLHLICRLRPADEFVKIVQAKCAQNFCGELHFAAMQIVFAQNKTQRLNNEKIAAARVSKNVSPAARLFYLIATSPSDRRAAPGVDDNPLAAPERRSQTRIAIISRDDFRGWPNFSANMGERRLIFHGTAGEKDSSAINLFW